MDKTTGHSSEDIILTDRAAKRVNAILTGEGKENNALRVSVSGGGCSGMSYNLTFDKKEKEFDKVYISKGIKRTSLIPTKYYSKNCP